MAAIAEDCISLIVCNVPVVATNLIRKIDETEEPNRKSRVTNWTLSLNFAKTKNAAESTIGATTETGWLRWERELEPESSANDTSTVVSSHVELTGTTQRPTPIDITKPRVDDSDADYTPTQDDKRVNWA